MIFAVRADYQGRVSAFVKERVLVSISEIAGKAENRAHSQGRDDAHCIDIVLTCIEGYSFFKYAFIALIITPALVLFRGKVRIELRKDAYEDIYLTLPLVCRRYA